MTERAHDGDDFIFRLPTRAELASDIRDFLSRLDTESVVLGVGAGSLGTFLGFVIGIFIWG